MKQRNQKLVDYAAMRTLFSRNEIHGFAKDCGLADEHNYWYNSDANNYFEEKKKERSEILEKYFENDERSWTEVCDSGDMRAAVRLLFKEETDRQTQIKEFAEKADDLIIQYEVQEGRFIPRSIHTLRIRKEYYNSEKIDLHTKKLKPKLESYTGAKVHNIVIYGFVINGDSVYFDAI